MKLLFGAAAVAVILFVGYFFVGEFRASQRADRMAAQQQCGEAHTTAEQQIAARERGETISESERAQTLRDLQRCQERILGR